MAAGRPALIIAAHGSRIEGWSDAVEDFVHDVESSPGVRDAFALVESAYLEHGVPSIPDAARVALSSGCSEVVVVPLFLTASAHATEDVPALLGKPVPDEVRRRLLAEGHAPLAASLPIRIVSLGAIDALLARNVRRRVSLASRNPAHEAVVLCAYGSDAFGDRWEALMHAVRMRLMRAGFGYACHAWVGHVVGHSPAPTASAIVAAGRMAGIRRVHVAPLLMSVSNLQLHTIAAAVRDADRRVRAAVSYSADAILPDGDLAAHAGYRALEALGIFPSMTGFDVDA